MVYIMDEKDIAEQIAAGRRFTRMSLETEGFQSDQQLKKPQPPLVKEPVSRERIPLPMEFQALPLKQDFLRLLQDRESRRIYSEEEMSLLELSFLLWATQGIKCIRGNNYCTLRTVPSGGARHEFETYLVVNNISALKPGAYHYLPQTNELEFLSSIEDGQAAVHRSLCGQRWAYAANVIFYWSMVPYRCEWRYGIAAHRPALIDAGHIGQNLYLACEAAGLGTCAVAAYDGEYCQNLFGLDGEEEYIVYAAPVGKINPQDHYKEQDIYAFLKKE